MSLGSLRKNDVSMGTVKIHRMNSTWHSLTTEIERHVDNDRRSQPPGRSDRERQDKMTAHKRRQGDFIKNYRALKG